MSRRASGSPEKGDETEGTPVFEVLVSRAQEASLIFQWVATFSPDEFFNCLIYLSRLGSADVLCCLLIA